MTQNPIEKNNKINANKNVQDFRHAVDVANDSKTTFRSRQKTIVNGNKTKTLNKVCSGAQQDFRSLWCSTRKQNNKQIQFVFKTPEQNKNLEQSLF